MISDSVGALHVALTAAVVGWLVFCVSHSLSVWKKRNSNGEAPSTRGLLYAGLMLCIAALAAGWLDRELTRRAGVILGTDFFVVLHTYLRVLQAVVRLGKPCFREEWQPSAAKAGFITQQLCTA
jgi:hypothetical protein